MVDSKSTNFPGEPVKTSATKKQMKVILLVEKGLIQLVLIQQKKTEETTENYFLDQKA